MIAREIEIHSAKELIGSISSIVSSLTSKSLSLDQLTKAAAIMPTLKITRTDASAVFSGGVRIYNLARGAQAAPGSMDPLVILQARFFGCQIVRKGSESSSNYLDALHSYSRTTTLLLQHPTMMALAKEGLQAIVDIFSSTLGGIEGISKCVRGAELDSLVAIVSDAFLVAAKQYASSGNTAEACSLIDTACNAILPFYPSLTMTFITAMMDLARNAYNRSEDASCIELVKRSSGLIHSLLMKPKADQGALDSLTCQVASLAANSFVNLKRFDEALHHINILVQKGSSFAVSFLKVKFNVGKNDSNGALNELKIMLLSDLSSGDYGGVLHCCKVVADIRSFDSESVQCFHQCAVAYPSLRTEVKIALIRGLSTVLDKPGRRDLFRRLLAELSKDLGTGSVVIKKDEVEALQDLIYNMCDLAYQQLEYHTTIDWCEILLPFCHNHTSYSAAVLRLLSLCYLKTGKMLQALQNVDLAIEMDPGVVSHFCKLQISLEAEAIGAAKDKTHSALRALCEAPDFEVSHLCMVVSLCVNNNDLLTAQSVLEKMVLDGKLKALVTEESTYKASSLFKLMIEVLFEVNGVTDNQGEGSFRRSSGHFSAAAYDVLITYIGAAVSYLQSLKDLTISLRRSSGSTINEKRASTVDDTLATIKKFFGEVTDITFLQSVCWNSAIDCNSSTNFSQAAKLFHLQFELGKFLPLSKGNAASLQTLLLLSAACKLHSLSEASRLVSRGMNAGPEGEVSAPASSMVMADVKSSGGDSSNGNVIAIGKHILELLSQAKLEGEKCRDLSNTLALESFSSAPSASTPFVHTPELALKISNIIEFEVLVQLQTDPNDLIYKVSSFALLPLCDSDFFFELANTPNLPASVEYSVLEVCYKLSLRNQVIDYNKLGQTIKRLSITAETRQISFSWFEQAWQIESARSKSMDTSTSKGGGKFSPEMMEWFTTQCWNFGVFYSRLSLYEQAETFLALALQLLPYAPVLRTTFGEDLDVAYSRLLSLLKKTESTITDE